MPTMSYQDIYSNGEGTEQYQAVSHADADERALNRNNLDLMTYTLSTISIWMSIEGCREFTTRSSSGSTCNPACRGQNINRQLPL